MEDSRLRLVEPTFAVENVGSDIGREVDGGDVPGGGVATGRVSDRLCGIRVRP